MLSKEDVEVIQKIVNSTFLNGIDQVVMPVLDEILGDVAAMKDDVAAMKDDVAAMKDDTGQTRQIVMEDVKRHDYFSEKIADHDKRITKLEHPF